MLTAIHLRSRGFTLVEVLVALVVLSIGMLGIAVLLLNSLQASRNALERSQAVAMAADIAERIRANRAGGNWYDTTDGTVAPAVDPNCETAGATCDEVAMAGTDLANWQANVGAALPEGQGTVGVEGITATLNRYTITVSWAQSGEADPVSYLMVVDI